jgi:hypothetical protein
MDENVKIEIKGQNIFPLVKGPEFVMGCKEIVENRFGKVAPDHPMLPVVMQVSERHDFYILCGVDTGKGYAYLTNGDFGRLGISHKDLMDRMLENLERVIGGIILEKKYTHVKQEEGRHSFTFPNDLAPSFILVAHKHYDVVENETGIMGAEFFYVLTVTTGEIIVCGPSLPVDALGFLVEQINERKDELAGEAGRPEEIVSVEPVIITKEGWSFVGD